MIGDNKDNVEFIDEKQERKEHKFGSVKDILDGSLIANDFILKQLPYIVFVVILAFVYIANRYHAEKMVRESIELSKEISELRSQAITISSELMFISKQSEVAKLVESRGIGLKESVEPPRKIIIED
ncbi:MAG TPA: FtsL-like putative cell division protein [Bacteroidales bacterium]|nr:FtsL-like putative cell division protein [Bacteroidales bacterium]